MAGRSRSLVVKKRQVELHAKVAGIAAASVPAAVDQRGTLEHLMHCQVAVAHRAPKGLRGFARQVSDLVPVDCYLDCVPVMRVGIVQGQLRASRERNAVTGACADKRGEGVRVEALAGHIDLKLLTSFDERDLRPPH